jgi:serine/threonine protein kinase
MTDALIGKQLNNFRIDRLLGYGGMAQVYYGMDVGLNRPVAIKVIDERWRQDAPFTVRFISEAQTIATWRHDNIIQVYYAGNEDDLYYFVMEYIDGGDLTEYMEARHTNDDLMPYDKVISILQATASGLDYAHTKGVIHRDVKPSNIMMGNDNRVVLMDFGLALDVQKGTIGESFGTPHYIAPEQARDASTVVAQSDQYALGVIAFEMLTGQVPFDDPSAMSVALMHMTDEPPKPSSLNPNITPDVEDVLLKVLMKQPSERFPSCQAFVETLENALAGRPTLIEDDVSPTQIDEILINPSAKNQAETVIHSDNSPGVHTAQRPAQAPQTNNKSRFPLTLIAVVGLAIIIIGIIVVLGANNPEDNTLPTLVAQVVEIVTKTPDATDEPTDTQALSSVANNQITATDVPSTATTMPTNTAIPLATDIPTNMPILPSATSLPTQTPTPSTATDLPTDTPILPTATDLPTDTPILPTATDLPTDTPILPTATDLPTNTLVPPTATDLPTHTLVPLTATSIPTQTAIPATLAPTLAYPNGSPVVLYYNDSSVYIWNPTSERIRSGRFKFDALDSNGNTLANAFDGIRWTQFYSFIDSNGCVAIEMTTGSHLRPSECSNYNSVINAMSSSDLIFWTGQNLITGFRVLWQDVEVARCEISLGTCSFNIP